MNSNVKVGVRVRPPLQREVASSKFTNCVALDNSKTEQANVYVSLEDKPVVLSVDGCIPNGVAKYTFDRCFGFNSTQAEVYEGLVRPAVHAVLGGINATVFAYGQTGTGKDLIRNHQSKFLKSHCVLGVKSPSPKTWQISFSRYFCFKF